VPPCINKFYILDLQPENSWCATRSSRASPFFSCPGSNVQADQGHLTWDDYLENGALKAIKTSCRTSAKVKQINVLGFCVGGTMLTSALAVAQGSAVRSPAASLTLLTTLLDFRRCRRDRLPRRRNRGAGARGQHRQGRAAARQRTGERCSPRCAPTT
jgi:polyhydroxyalkanoate synthase